MNELDHILRALDERELALAVGKQHDEARLRYTLSSITVEDFAAFERLIGDYYAYHFSSCVAPGAQLPEFEARQRAKELLERSVRDQGGTLASLCADAIDGRDGGTRRVLDLICDGLKHESQSRYIESVFDRFVAPTSFDEKVEIIRQLMQKFANILPRSMNTSRPEQYAHDYKQFVRAFADALRNVARAARR